MRSGLKPLHRSPAALRDVTAARAVLPDEALFLARELPNTRCPPREVVPTVAPLARWVKLEPEAVLPPRARPRARVVPTARFEPMPVAQLPAVAPLVAPAPLVPTEGPADGSALTVVDGAVAGTGVALGGGATGGAGATVTAAGGAAGVAGVPKVAGVHAHVRLAPTTVASPAKIATEMNRVFLRT